MEGCETGLFVVDFGCSNLSQNPIVHRNALSKDMQGTELAWEVAHVTRQIRQANVHGKSCG